MSGLGIRRALVIYGVSIYKVGLICVILYRLGYKVYTEMPMYSLRAMVRRGVLAIPKVEAHDELFFLNFSRQVSST